MPRGLHHRQCVSVHCRTVRNKTGFASSSTNARAKHVCHMLSALKSLQNGLLHNPLVAEVLYVYNATRGSQLTFLWIPSCGYTRKRVTDTLAKFALYRDVIVDVKFSFRDLRPLVTSYVTELWRSDWENDSTNKLQHHQTTSSADV